VHGRVFGRVVIVSRQEGHLSAARGRRLAIQRTVAALLLPVGCSIRMRRGIRQTQHELEARSGGSSGLPDSCERESAYFL
jgi:hypothetical protein